MTALDLYRSGKLTEAIPAAVAEVKAQPADAKARLLLADLLCFAGDLTRADTQLDAIMNQDPNALILVSQFRQLIRAEQARQQVFSDGRVPEFNGEPDEDLRGRLQAVVAIRAGRHAEAAKILTDLETAYPPLRGTCDGQAFSQFCDLDDLCGSFLEVLTSNGKYYWVPLNRLESIEFLPVKSRRDMLWRPTKISVRGGSDGNVHVPVLYTGTQTSADDSLRLGRSTDWTGGNGAPTRGAGQRTFLVGERDVPMLSMKTIALEQAVAAGTT